MLTRAMASPDQPTAPYLDAVVAYGFRGSTRFHVPGHKAGNAADLGVRTAFGWQTHRLDIPQDIHGVDLGPSPTPYERAEQLAAEAYGAARSWFLTNGATQGNHALCLAPNRDNAVKLLEFLVSPEAQAIYARANFEYPIVAGAEVDAIIADLGTLTIDPLPLSAIGAHRKEASELVDKVGFDAEM